MYSVVLMAALTTSVDLPEIGHRGGGCNGCYGGGCYGGGGRGGRRGGGCCGCYGGGGYGGCYGGGYGGGYVMGGCYGGGGYGGCYGGGGYGGCYGGGGYGGGCFGGYGGGGIMMPGTGTGTGTGGEKLKTAPKSGGKETEVLAPTSATIVVELPADAKLLIDNEATTSTGSSRVFQSPELNPGKSYHYTLKAEVVREGKTQKIEQVVTVKAGEITPVTLTLPAAGVAQR